MRHLMRLRSERVQDGEDLNALRVSMRHLMRLRSEQLAREGKARQVIGFNAPFDALEVGTTALPRLSKVLTFQCAI